MNAILARSAIESVWNGHHLPRQISDIIDRDLPRRLSLARDKIALDEHRYQESVLPRNVIDNIRASALQFHRRAGTLTSSTNQAIASLFDRPALRVAHTPDLLPYYSVAMLPLVANLLAGLLEDRIGTSVPQLYISVDTDDAADRRIRTASFPDQFRRNGELSLSVPIARSDRHRMVAAQAGPTTNTVLSWRQLCISTLVNHVKILRIRGYRSAIDTMVGRLDTLIEDMTFAAEASDNLADFNMIFLSRLANLRMRLPTVFLSQRALARILGELYLDQYDNANDWIRMSMESANTLSDAGFDMGSLASALRAPFWSVCTECGTRTTSIRVPGCVHERLVVPTVLVDNLFDRFLLGCCGGVSYVGSASHVLVSLQVLRRLGQDNYREVMFAARGSIGGPVESVQGSLHKTVKSGAINLTSSGIQRCKTGRTTLIYPIVTHGLDRIINEWRSHLSNFEIGSELQCEEGWAAGWQTRAA